MRERPNKEVGGWGEQTALDYLRGKGLRPLLRNYRCKGGELDLVMLDGATLALIEARVRCNDRFGGAAASVTPAKQRRIIVAARHLLLTHAELKTYRARFDVIAIDHGRVEWIKDAFRM